jgi:transposase
MNWATPRMDRKQILLFHPNLEQMIPPDHPVRLLDEILRSPRVDWRPWEAHYCGYVGQPPIHPRVLASAILYGMTLGIRSSRKLEDACCNRLDFIWLVEGRRIDHSTFAGFRTRFERELKGLFREVVQVAMRMGLARLGVVALDGTQARANSSRHATASEETIQKRLGEIDAAIETMFAEYEQADAREGNLFGEESPTKLPRKLADLKRRQERLAKALEAVQAKEAQSGSSKKKPKVPLADPDAGITPNKEGGYAPNHTPLAATEGQGGFIVDADVIGPTAEGDHTVVVVDRIEETYGEKPGQVLADSAFGSGQNLAGLDQREVEAFIPQEQRPTGADNPAIRSDPTQPVAAADWPRLPRNARTKKLDRSAFVYDAAGDFYHCPTGQKLPFVQRQTKPRRTGPVEVRVYRCAACAACELRGECVAKKAQVRTISRDEYEPLREAMDARLASERGRATYRRRSWIAETPFAFIKAWMGFRQFLLRGLDKVRTEWLWTCTAFNLRKLMIAAAGLRAALAAALV